MCLGAALCWKQTTLSPQIRLWPSPSGMPLCALTAILSPKVPKTLAPCVDFAPIYLSSTGLTVLLAQSGPHSPYPDPPRNTFNFLALHLYIQRAQENPSSWIPPPSVVSISLS